MVVPSLGHCVSLFEEYPPPAPRVQNVVYQLKLGVAVQSTLLPLLSSGSTSATTNATIAGACLGRGTLGHEL